MLGGGLAVCAFSCAEKALATPIGRSLAVAALPFVLLAAAIAMDAVTTAQVAETANCLVECASMRSYAIGGGVAYLLAIQAAYKRGDKTLPKETETVPLPPVKNAAGKLAAKAA